MSFVLHRAERADVLSDVLADILAVPLDDPFSPEVVSVYSRGIERWLSHRLAARLGSSPGRSDGVCANLEFPFPGRLVGDALAAATGLDPDSDPWRPERLAWPLLDVVEANLDEEWLRLLATHLRGDQAKATNGAAEANADRRFAAVRHLATLFDRYATHRPGMILAWAEGDDQDGSGTALPSDAAWQANLWRRVRALVGVDSPPERAEAGCRALRGDPGLVDLPSRVSLFGLTRLPASYFEVLRSLAEHREVHLLALNPSPIAWQRIADDPTIDADAATALVRHPLLRAWGRDSREMHLVLARTLAEDDAVSDRHHPLSVGGASSLLHQLQTALRDDEPPAAERFRLDEDDRSIQIHACHGRARQAEVVRDAVLHLLADDPTLEPRDIVIMCPDIDEIAPRLRAAFDRAVVDDTGEPGHAAPDGGMPSVRYRLADRSLRDTNPVLGAVAELLALVDSRLTASQVLTFASLPPVRHRFRFDDGNLERIAGWVEATGIRWGLDAEHRRPYDLAEVAAGTWDAGLKRLLLGVTMSEEDLRLVGGVLPLEEVDSGEIDLAGRFAELVGRLGDVVRSLGDQRPMREWADAINHAANLLFDVRPVDGWQRAALDRLLDEVLDEAGGADVSLRLAEVRDLLADRLRGRPTRAAFRTGDLTMCTLVPMRSVPHRVVCLVGLDDGAFPRGGARDGDDLLIRARHLGDHDRRAEDRQLLLDAVLAAGDALVITYSGRDPRTNEALPPAVPVNELLDVIDAMATTGDGARRPRDQIVHHHPLHGFDARCFVPGALGADGPWGFDAHLLAGARAAAQPVRPPAPFLEDRLDPLDEAIVSLDELVAFVSHPVRAFLRKRLGLSLRADEDRPLDALVVELDNLAAWSVGDRMLAALQAGGEVDDVIAAEAARGLLPPGALGQRTLDEARDKAVKVHEKALSIATGARTSLDIDVTLSDGRRLVGTVPDLVGDVIRATSVSRLKGKQRVSAWTRFLAAVAAHPERELTSSTVGWRKGKATYFTLRPQGSTADERRAKAVELLEVLVDLRDRGMREPLPLYCETSYLYASARHEGSEFPFDDAAKDGWVSSYDWHRENRDAEHRLVLGGEQPFEVVRAIPPEPYDDGPGWPSGESTRFGLLACRLWRPIFAATRKPAP